MKQSNNDNLWNYLSTVDPFWAILSYPDKRGNKWNIEEFFKSGEIEIESDIKMILNEFNTLNFNNALDFGCGVGRCSRSLSKFFNLIIGIDVSENMIKSANELNQNIKNCNFVLNKKDDLVLFSDNYFDFIYCNLTLQHLNRELQLKYISEFCRIIKSEGIVMFQVILGYSKNLKGLLKSIIGEKLSNYYNRYKNKLEMPIEMNIVKHDEIIKIFKSYNMTLFKRVNVTSAFSAFNSYKYIVKKN